MSYRSLLTLFLASAAMFLTANSADAELRMCSLFTDHMVVQRNGPIRVWGWAAPGQSVSVDMAGQSVSGLAGDDGRFDVELPSLEAGGPHVMTVQAGGETKSVKDVLVGEVWICSGQSNMQWSVASSDDADLESLAADYPQIRLITVPRVGTQEPQDDFEGAWSVCSPVTVKDFSGVGYFFGRQLHQSLDIPVGLIDDAWGGSAVEAWIPREALESNESAGPLLKHWDNMAATLDVDKQKSKADARLKAWVDGGRKGNRPRAFQNPLVGNHRPANIYNGVLNPTIGYSIKGAIWYQGESNASRAYQYRELFPLMIQTWRDKWGQGDFPFYWVQLADFKAEQDQPGDSDWAELREAQTMTMDRLPNTGEAVILNLGEGNDIHPTNKQAVGKRLARWALNRDYGVDIPCESPRFDSMTIDGDKATLTFKNVGRGLDTFDVREMLGFTIAGEDMKFQHATAKLKQGTKDTVIVQSGSVSKPVAVRYAWADNPVCNVRSRDGLALTPFRTDETQGITAGRLAP